jgi:hypothetical protein
MAMLWLREEPVFREVLREAQKLVSADRGREQTTLQRLVFDDAQLCTSDFARLLRSLMLLSADLRVYYLVLSPDPVHYFHRHFNKYPLFEFGRDDSVDSYLVALNEDPGGSPADAVGTNWSASVIFPPGAKWFSHLLRSASDSGGHLWIPREWTETVIADYPYLRIEPDR